MEETNERHWLLAFQDEQAFRVTTIDCAGSLLEQLPENGGFFEVLDSSWILSLRYEKEPDQVKFLDNSRHFVICSYDDIVEIVAHEYRVAMLDEVGYPFSDG